MPESNQTAFSAGEVSPEVLARTDINKFYTSLKKCRNMLISPTGGVYNRPGFRFVTETKDSTKHSIVQEFIFSEEQSYILEFGNEYVRFITNGAQLVIDDSDVDAWVSGGPYDEGDYVTYNNVIYYSLDDNTSTVRPSSNATHWVAQDIYERPTPYVSTATYNTSDIFDLRFESSGDVIWITHPDYQPRTLTRFGATDWRLELYEPEDGPFMAENTDLSISLNVSAVTGSNVTLTAASALFESTHVGALWLLRHYVAEQKATGNFSGTGTTSGIKCFTTWRVISHGTWTGTFSVQKSSNGGTTWTNLRTFTSVNDFNANTSGTEDIETNSEPFLVRLNMSAYTSGTANIDLTTDAFYQEGIVKVITYNSSTSVQAEVLLEVGSTSTTISWNEGSWSDFRGWPRVVRFYKDRLVFAGTEDEPMNVWMTQTSDYYSFKRHTPLLDTDGITVSLPARQVNIINGMVALQRLIVLTSNSEWSIGPGSSGVLTPTSIDQRNENYRGSSGINPIVIGDETIYVQANGKVVRNLGYNLGSDSFKGSQMNILAEHLFRKWTIRDLAYQQDPDSIIWALRSDGKLLACTYLPEQEVIAWSQHDTGSDQ